MPKQQTQGAVKGQLAKFKQAARDLGTDDSEKRFNERLSKIARQKPTEKPKKKGPGK